MTSQLMASPVMSAAPAPTPPAPSSRRRGEAAVVLVVAAIAGIAAATARPSPIGRPLVDAVVVGVAAGAVTLAGATAPRWTLVVLAATAIAIGGAPAVAAAGVVALGLALLAAPQRRYRTVLAAMSTAIAVGALGRAELDAAFGVTAAISLTACTLVFLAGIRNRSRRVRRVAYAAIAVGFAFAAVSVVAFGLAAYNSRHDLTQGVRAAEQAVAALEVGDYETAEREFEVAADALDRANAELSSPLVAGAGFVPVIAQHHDAAFDMSAVGAVGAAAVAAALDDVDPDALRFERGRIDVAAITALADPLHRVEAALHDLHATVDESMSPWLVGRAAVEMRDFQTSVAEHLPQLENALDVVERAPRLLGAERPRVYLVLFTTPSEARALGGFTGNYAELSIDDGQLALRNLGRASEFDAAAQAAGVRVAGPRDFLERYGQFGYDGPVGGGTLRNLNMTPNFPWVGAIARDVYAETTGRTVDGVIAVDPYVIAALLEYSGPIQLTTFAQQLDAGNAAPFLLRDQYVLGAEDNEQRVDALAEAAEHTMSAVLGGSLPDPTTIAGDLAPLAEQRRLMLWSADPVVQQLIEQIDLDGAIPDLDGREGWSVTFSNAGGSKIDSFLVPTTSYSSSVDAATGRTAAELRVRLSNTAPANGLPRYVIGNDVGLPPGTSRLYVSAYSSLDLAEATVDGEPVTLERESEAGWNVYSQFVEIPPGGTVTLVFALDGVVAKPGEVVTWQQPLAFDVDPTVV
jgi:hypothetical protein